MNISSNTQIPALIQMETKNGVKVVSPRPVRVNPSFIKSQSAPKQRSTDGFEDLGLTLPGKKRKRQPEDIKVLEPTLPKAPRIAGRRLRDYFITCRKEKIALPVVNEREMDHLFQCSNCQSVWPLFYALHHVGSETTEPLTLEEISIKWSRMTETQRVGEYKVLEHKEADLFRSLKKYKCCTGYQLFIAENKHEMKKTEDADGNYFDAKTKQLGHRWKNLSKIQKDKFNAASLALKEKRLGILTKIKSLSFLKKRYKIYLKNHKPKDKPPKPKNSFFFYLQARWKKEQAEAKKFQKANPKYREVMKQASHDWKTNVSESTKEKYERLAKNDLEEYFRKKEILKDQSRDAKRRKGDFGMLKVPLPVHPGNLDMMDMGSDDED